MTDKEKLTKIRSYLIDRLYQGDDITAEEYRNLSLTIVNLETSMMYENNDKLIDIIREKMNVSAKKPLDSPKKPLDPGDFLEDF